MKKINLKKVLFSLYVYFCFFITTAFTISCCIMLFLTLLSKKMNIELTKDNLKTAAILTFINVVFLSFVYMLIDKIRRKFTIEKPVKRIVSGTEKIMKGDFSVRIPMCPNTPGMEQFNIIIECFNKMAKELSGNQTLQSDFIANVSHELKTPLSVMQNYGVMLQAPNLSDEKRIEYSKAITSASGRLANLVTNVLKLSKLENQQIYPDVKKYDLGEQLCGCLVEFENLWEEKQIEVDTEIESDVFVNTDPELLIVVWNNLLSNAFKFTEKGGKVSLFMKSENENAVVTVSDSGCGINEKTGKHIFDKFYQGDTSHSMQGNGLGLALVRRVADIVGADISVKSREGEGSSFTVTIRRDNYED